MRRTAGAAVSAVRRASGTGDSGGGARLTPAVTVREPPITIPGPEDIVIDHAAGLAFVASQRRRRGRRRLSVREMPGGAVYALDLSTVPARPRVLADQEQLGFPFHPRGCAFHRGPEGRRLMVISIRPTGEHVVEAFEVSGEAFGGVRLRHLRTIADPALVCPNDLVALDGDRFFAANDHGTRPGWRRTVEDLLARPLSTVVFWDGARCRAVAGGLVFGNGIALDRARRRLLVAATRERRLRVWDLDPGDPARLAEAAPIPLPGCPDNLEWDEDGALWIGAHPSLTKLALYHAGLRAAAPSQVLRVRFDATGRAGVDEVWRDPAGAAIAGASTAAVHGRGAARRLLLGQALGDHVRDCGLGPG